MDSPYILSVDASGRTIVVNQALQARTGYGVKDAPTYRELLELLFHKNPRQAERLWRLCQTTLEKRAQISTERRLTLHCRDGTQVEVSWNVALFYGASGAPAGFVGIGADAAESASEWGQVSDVEAHYGRERGGVLAWVVTDMVGERVLDASPRTCELSGRSLETLRETPVARLIGPDDVAAFRDCIQQVRTQGYGVSPQLHWLTESGALVAVRVMASLTAVDDEQAVLARLDESPPGDGAVKEDEGPRQALGRSAADAPLVDMIAEVALDLRNPLTSIVGFGELLCEGRLGSLQPRQLEVLERIRRQANRLSGMVDDLLGAREIERGALRLEFGPVAADELLRNSASQAQDLAAQKAIGLDVLLPDSLPPVWADGPRLGRVVEILLDHAIRCATSGSALRLEARVREQWVEVALVGSLLGAESQARLERLAGDEAPGARGLGAAGGSIRFARGLVELHRGQMRVEHGPGGREAIVVQIPLAESSAGRS